MIGLYLLAAHMLGDYLLQSRTMAARKLVSARVRTTHVGCYLIPFVPVAAVYARPWGLSGWVAAPVFLLAVGVLHWLTDSRRFLSNPADVIEWKLQRRADPAAATRAWVDHLYGGEESLGREPLSVVLERRLKQAQGVAEGTLRMPPPNPWPVLPILIDQSLHLAQLALLGGLLLHG